MITSEQPFLPWKIGVSIIHAIAILSTIFRLEHRRRTQRLWWDDYATIIPLALELPNMAVLWLRYRHMVPDHEKILLSYTNQFFYPTINWWSRISISLAVLRVTPIQYPRMRCVAMSIPIIFVIFWFSLSTAAIAACVLHTEWQLKTSFEIMACTPRKGYETAVTVIEICGDVALLVVPLQGLWNVSRRPNERLLVRLVFSCSAITAVSSLLLCNISYGHYFTGPGGLVVWLMVCYIATALGIITSNLLVLTCWARHHCTSDKHPMEENDIHITPHQWASTHSWHCAERSTFKDTSVRDNIVASASIINETNLAASEVASESKVVIETCGDPV